MYSGSTIAHAALDLLKLARPFLIGPAPPWPMQDTGFSPLPLTQGIQNFWLGGLGELYSVTGYGYANRVEA